jgi:DNA methylase
MYVNQKLLDAIVNTEAVDGFTHGFYRYPARFSPIFVRAAIERFSKPGDVILDPFMGSGTTMVEACVSGRRAVGCDINSLAVFLSKLKTTVFTAGEIESVRCWAVNLSGQVDISNPKSSCERELNGMAAPDTWRLRKAIQSCLDSIQSLPCKRTMDFARCVILRAAQWALDCRSNVPTLPEFREQLAITAEKLLEGALDFSQAVRARRKEGWHPTTACFNTSAAGLHALPIWQRVGRPRLILTSPPYPGVHVLYHRWQIRGRRETPVPYWISGTRDGNGASFYTFGDRKQKDLTGYFRRAEETFSSIASICNGDSMVVQMIAFSNPTTQLPRYLDAMRKAGLDEVQIKSTASKAGRIWRHVPNRKWYAEQKANIGSASEVVLFHRKK